jgi:hypothetical protein
MLNRPQVPFLRLTDERRMRLIPPVAVFLAMTVAAIGQAPKPEPLGEGTSAIRGTVTDALTNTPLAGCEVRAAACRH